MTAKPPSADSEPARDVTVAAEDSDANPNADTSAESKATGADAAMAEAMNGVASETGAAHAAGGQEEGAQQEGAQQEGADAQREGTRQGEGELVDTAAAASPPRRAPAIGSMTLLGIGSNGTPLPATTETELALDQEPADADLGLDDLIEDEALEAPPAYIPRNVSMTSTSDDTQVTSLLDEVAHALNAEASQHRAQARAKAPSGTSLPGTPVIAANKSDFEFEDPDDGPTALTPGALATGEDVSLDDEEDEEAVVLGPAKKPESRADGTHTPFSMVSGRSSSGPTSLGPPPGAAGMARTTTPHGGLPIPVPPSGRVRLPTPVPGRSAAIPAPTSGRTTLQLGLAGASAADPDALFAGTSAADSPRKTTGSGKTITRTPSGGVPDPMGPQTTDPIPAGGLPAFMQATVKLAAPRFAGVVAVTFIGGLLIGRLVSKGPTDVPRPPEPPVATAPAAPVVVPGTPPASSAVAPTAVAPAAPAAPAPTAATAPVGTTAPIVAPIAEEKPVEGIAANDDAAAKPLGRRPGPKARAKKAATDVTAAEDMFPKQPKPAVAPKAPSAASGPSKPMANNGAKAGAKPKSKSTWHDPFAD